MEFKDWLAQQIEKRGTNATAVASAISENQPTIQRILSGETKNPRLKIIRKLEDFFADKFTGSNEIDFTNNEEYPSIKRVSLKLSAGVTGFAIDYDIQDKTPIVMRKEWFDSRGYRPEKLLAVMVNGDSMQNGLYDGDTVVINTADTKPTDGDVFAVNYEGEMLVKRLVRDNGEWWLSSDNSDQRKFPRKQCSGDMCIIIGKIVHKQSERI